METTSERKIRQCIEEIDLFERRGGDKGLALQLIADGEHRLRKSDEAESPFALKLKGRLLSLMYRLELAAPPAKSELAERFLSKVKKWIDSYKGFNPENFDWTPSKKIERVVKSYPAFGEHLLESPALFDRFCKWSFRDGNEIEPFIEFPSLVERLIECNFSQRLGIYKTRHLTLHRTQDYRGQVNKWLTIKMDGHDVNFAREETTVRLRVAKNASTLSYTVGEIFSIFKNKTKHPGELELLLEKGICYWPSYEPWKVIDLDTDIFWKTGETLRIRTLEELHYLFGKTLPGIHEVTEEVQIDEGYVHVNGLKVPWIEEGPYTFLENRMSILNRVEVVKREGNRATVRMRERVALDGKNFAYVLRATQEKEMSLLRTHGFSDVLIPLGDGTYFVYDDGKYPQKYPASLMRLLFDFVRTVLAAMQLYDDNYWFNHRFHTHEAIGLRPDQGRILMEIKRFILKLARDDKLGFEFQAEGCAKGQQVDVFKLLIFLAQKNVKSEIELITLIRDTLYSEELNIFDAEVGPNFFKTSLQEVYPEGFLGSLYSVIRLAPYKIQPYLIYVVYILFGAWNGLKLKLGVRDIELKHVDSPCWMDETPYRHSLYHPGWLHYQQKAIGITLASWKEWTLRKDPLFKRL